MTSWWSTAAGAIVIVTALGNGFKLLVPQLDQERGTSSTTRVDSPLPANEVSFFDAQRRAAAYLDPADNRTIYLWSGEPVAYLDDEAIYGFNGKHLGWYANGMMFDHDGRVVAGPAIAFRKPVGPAPARGHKGVKPSAGPKEPTPLMPSLMGTWSDLPAHDFFLQVIN